MCCIPFLAGFYSKDLILEITSFRYLNIFVFFFIYLFFLLGWLYVIHLQSLRFLKMLKRDAATRKTFIINPACSVELPLFLLYARIYVQVYILYSSNKYFVETYCKVSLSSLQPLQSLFSPSHRNYSPISRNSFVYLVILYRMADMHSSIAREQESWSQNVSIVGVNVMPVSCDAEVVGRR